MAKPLSRSTLYRLIEAGQLARKALLLPLLERGLEPGDDAVLFVLARPGATEARLIAETGLSSDALAARLARLADRELIVTTDAKLTLTDRGERLRATLAETWTELEHALLGDLHAKQQKHLRRTLKRFVEQLRP